MNQYKKQAHKNPTILILDKKQMIGKDSLAGS